MITAARMIFLGVLLSGTYLFEAWNLFETSAWYWGFQGFLIWQHVRAICHRPNPKTWEVHPTKLSNRKERVYKKISKNLFQCSNHSNHFSLELTNAAEAPRFRLSWRSGRSPPTNPIRPSGPRRWPSEGSFREKEVCCKDFFHFFLPPSLVSLTNQAQKRGGGCCF